MESIDTSYLLKLPPPKEARERPEYPDDSLTVEEVRSWVNRTKQPEKELNR